MMFNAIMEAVSEQFLFITGPVPTAPLQIKFDRYVYWLETKLNSVSAAELSELNNITDQLTESIASLKGMSAHCRATMVLNNSTQANRIHKLYDHIDSLFEPYSPGRLFIGVSIINGTKYTITSLLPDMDVLRDVIADNKAKLKLIEEIASSKKTEVVKFKTSKLTTSNRSENKKTNEIQMIRTEVRSVQALLDQLTVEVERQHSVLKYFGQLKHVVHFPLQALSTHLRSLPPLAETSAQLEHDLQALNSVNSFYTMVRSVDILAQAAASTQEAAHIEKAVQDEVSWLRLLADKELLSMMYESSRSFVPVDGNANWAVYLRKFCQLALSDLLTLCGSTEGGEALQSCVRNLRHFFQGVKNDHPLMNKVSSRVPGLVSAFDAEMFCAHAQDYCERLRRYASLVERKEFSRAYEKLCEGRTAMDKAQRKYNRTAALFEEYLQLHREANTQLTQLKERCIEIALAEVSEHIEFIA